MTAPLGFVVGLTAEAKIAARFGGLVETGGGTPDGAADAAQRLIRKGVCGLISFGLAGGLDPQLKPGTIVIPGTILSGGQAFHADPGLAARFGGLTSHTMLAGTAIAPSAAIKNELFLETGADGIDLESGAVARIAHAQGLPFAAVRAICDPANRNLPPAALTALDQSGAIGLLAVLTSVARHPSQIPELLNLAKDATKARQALIRLIQQPLMSAGACADRY